MPRKRKGENRDLPTHLYSHKDASYRYMRADTKKCVSVGRDKVEAIKAAKVANMILGVDEVLSLGTRMPPLWYRRRLNRYMSANKESISNPIVQKIFLEQFETPKRDDKKTLGWASVPVEGRQYSGRRYAKVKEIDPENPPAWVASLYRNTEKNAKRREIKFDLTRADLVEMLSESQGVCAVSGIKLRLDEVKQKNVRRPWAPSIDRIDSFAGYSRENCRIVCVAANIAMGQWGEEILLALAKGIAKKNIIAGS